MKNLKAFTVVEMMVALTLTAVLSTITFYALFSVNSLLSQKNSVLKKIEKQSELRFLMNLDLNRNFYWELGSDEKTMQTLDKRIEYKFDNNTIIRKQGDKSEAFEFEKLEVKWEKTKNSKILKKIVIEIQSNKKVYSLSFMLNSDSFIHFLSSDGY